MIDPIENRTPVYASLSLCALYALLVKVDRDGRLIKNDVAGGYDAMPFSVTHGNAQRLADGCWIVAHGSYDDPNGDTNFHLKAGQIVRMYARADHLLDSVGRDSELNRWLSTMGPPTLVITSYDDINAFWRGLQHAMKRELSAAEEMRALCEMSDAVLAHALITNLDDKINLDQHRANVAELQRFAESGSGEEMQQVRDFLGSMEGPNDRTQRHNVWRMVLIVRAVQRRASTRATGKMENVASLTMAYSTTSAYIADILADARRMAQKLENHQPWWSGHGPLSEEIGRRRRNNLAHWLERQVVSLEMIHANPFRAWALRAAYKMNWLALTFRASETDAAAMRAAANEAVFALRAIPLMEMISRAIMEEHERVGKPDGVAGECTRRACSDVIAWACSSPHLRNDSRETMRELLGDAQLAQASWGCRTRLEALRRLGNWMAKLPELIAT